MEWGAVAFAVGVVLLASTAQSVAGFGFALIAVPLFVTVLDVRDAVVLTTLLGVVNTGILAVTNRRNVPWSTVLPLLAGAIAGMPAGLAVLLLAPPDAIRLLVAAATLLMTVALLRGFRLESRSLLVELGVGGVSGSLNTSTGTNGPPVVLYLQGREFPPEEFRAALAVFFVTCNVITLGTFLASRIVTLDAVALFAAGLPAIAAGTALGHAVGRRVEAERFRALVFGLLVASALAAAGVAIAGTV
jgi:uncharacterized membrane protein YfcA